MPKTTRARTIYNSKCLCCSDMQHEMVKIGQMTFCPKCFKKEFVDTGAYNIKTHEVLYNSPAYQDWFESYKKYIVRIS
ncbi:MAG: hypothetical protein ACTSSP_00805 [Candidatus Asgardarchaeia archaeon]